MAEELKPGDVITQEVLPTVGANWFASVDGSHMGVQFKLLGGGLSPVYGISAGAVEQVVVALQRGAERCREMEEVQDGQG